MELTATDFLFMKYRSMTPKLLDIAKDYYPHLSKAETLRKAGNQEFPFPVFKIDKSNRAPYLVHINDLAKVLQEEFEKASSDFTKLHQ